MSAPPPGLAVIINGSGGAARKAGSGLAQQVADVFAEHGVSVEPQIVEGEGVPEAIAEAGRARTIAVGGGDGTQGSAAAVLAGSGQDLAVLPLGTLNHLAADLGIPNDLAEAARIAVHGQTAAIDLGEVNQTPFVNNASIGLYARMVKDRDARRLPKWLATLPAAWTVLRGLRHRAIVVELDGERHRIETPLLFVGNNRYAIAGPALGKRESLSDGLLSVYAVRQRSAMGLIAFALRALVGRADPATDFVGIRDTAAFRVLGQGTIDVAHDGEVTRMNLPLEFRSRPGALEVKVAVG